MSTERKIEVAEQCCMCGCNVPLKVYQEDYEEFKYNPNRRHVQDIFPYLTEEDREMFISHTCPTCWSDIFDDYEDEGYEPSAEDLKEWQDASCGRC